MAILKSLVKGKKFLVSFRVSISTAFLSILLCIAIAIISFTSYNFSSSLLYISNNFITASSNSIQQELSALLDPTIPSVNLSAKIILDKTVNIQNFPEVIEYTKDQLRVIPDAYMVHWGDVNGNYVVARRTPRNTIFTEYYQGNVSQPKRILILRNQNDHFIGQKIIVNDYDPRTRPWYVTAKSSNKPVWTNAYPFYWSQFGRKLGVSAAVPIYENQQLLGVFSIDMAIDSLSTFLAKHKISKNGRTMIIDNQGNLIAYPNLNRLLNVSQKNNTENLIPISALSNPVLTNAFEYAKNSKNDKFVFKFKGSRYLASFQKIPQFARYGWRIAIVVPEDDFLGSLKKTNFIIMIILMFILIIGLSLISIFSKRISIPIKKLSHELNEIKFFHIEPQPVIKTHIKEVYAMSKAIESMKNGLLSFQKYVPKSLVRQLIMRGEAAKIGGKDRKIVIFFSDIQNFTSIVEKVGSNKIMQYLCNYFDEMTHIISSYQGTVDKFIGDSIMAFWGAPDPDKNSVIHACTAALECQTRLEKLNQLWVQTGRTAFPTRMSIHFGDVLVGNLGSSERMNYTAIGDTVNVASRLEQLNKVYGTKILVSEIVEHKARDQFLFRIIDKVIVKGHIENNIIYELIQSKQTSIGDELSKFCTEYSKGFTAYQHQNWDQAITYFNLALAFRSNDVASKLMLERCYNFKRNPPHNDWDGSWAYTTKS